VYVSNDSGQSWNAINTGLPSGSGSLNISGIAISHQNHNKVYVSLHKGGIYVTENGGESWTSAMGNLPAGQSWSDVWDPTGAPIPRNSILSVAVDPNDDDTVYIGTNVHGVYKSEDGGANWTKALTEATMVAEGPSDHAHAMAVVVDPSDPQNIFIGDWHSGVYRSTDGGNNWSYVSDSNGMSTRAINALSISNDGRFVYAGTQGEGVFRYKAKNASGISSLD
jgi:photosystem II stability/assembly factor-like uncharacterized protein